MLQIKNLTITHKKDLRVILEDFHFVLNPGERAVLIGEEGNGKSTLLKWIYDPDSVADYVEAEGERICAGERLGFLPQELPEEDRRKSVCEFFSEEEMFWETDPRERGELARKLHLSPDFYYGEQEMGTLSGGEKVKAQMARLLMTKPTVLLLDEPSNDIDIETLEWLETFIGESPHPVLFVSHDETLIEKTANVVIHLEQIRRKTRCRYTVAHMGYREYMEQRSAQMDNQLQNAQNDRRQEKIRQEKLRRIMQKVEHDQEAVSRQSPAEARLLKKKMKAMKSMEKRFEREEENMTQMPESEEAIFLKFGQEIRIPEGKTILDFHLERLTTCAAGQNIIRKQGDMSAEKGNGPATQDISAGQEASTTEEGMPAVRRETSQAQENMSAVQAEPARVLAGEIHLTVKGARKVCIIGKNGIGKTTLLRRIAGEMLEREDIRAAYMPQNYEELLDMSRTPVEYLCETGDKEEITRIRTFLGAMKYTVDEMNHTIAELSGGQRAKVLLLKMSLSGANVLILDEPTRNFSPLSNPVIRSVLQAYKGAILSVSHDRKYIGEVCDTVYELTEAGLTY